MGQRRPDLLAHAHVLLAHALDLARVPVVGALALHQALVPLPASIARLGGEVVCLDLAPVLAGGSSGEEGLVVLGVPCARRRAVLGGERRAADGPANRCSVGWDAEGCHGVRIVRGHSHCLLLAGGR